MRFRTRLDRLSASAPAREPVIAHTLSTRALAASWHALEHRSFDASAEVIDAVASKLLAQPDTNPEVKARVQRYLAGQR